MQNRYYLLNKPYGYLSQFTDEGRWKGLNHIISVPKDVYSLGRLDAESEGLLLLTNDRSLNHTLLNPKKGHSRKYLVQVDGQIDEEAIRMLRNPLNIKVGKSMYKTLPASAEMIPKPDWVKERIPPVRIRKTIPTSWISLTLKEGKNRQVRKMTAAVGFPTLRLIRHSIEDLSMENLSNGEIQEMKELDFKSALYL